ncbi:hypothetical protein ACFCZ1_29515 [Streptomyces sp. NPDC056224]|uniref:hypothetical protein n=1 Tax=Streptomyces sp. NPDC056224 TaxID=3345750 RepID=UPI0035E0AC10
MEHERTSPEQRGEGEGGPAPDTSAPPSAVSAAPAAADAPVPGTTPAPRRGRARTPLLIAGASVLGILAGTITGYAVQYHRPPTPLPPLAQQKLPAPGALAPDDATTHQTINANRWHTSDGDLTKLLIGAPDGAETLEEPGYETLDSFATSFKAPDAVLSDLAHDGLRRIAAVTWRKDEQITEVRLVQFRDFSGADEYQRDQSSYMGEKDYAGNGGVAIPGVPPGLGHVWVHSETDEKPGYYPVRQSRAVVRRGDIVVQIFHNDQRGRNIAESDLIELAKRQLERL